MGVVEHKVMKNDGGANLSPGVEDLSSETTTGDTGLLLVEYLPFGVINSITPTTNSDINRHQSRNHYARQLEIRLCSVHTRMLNDAPRKQ